MYRLGRRGHARRKKHTWRAVLSVVIVAIATVTIGGYLFLSNLEEEPTVAQAITREFAEAEDNTGRSFEQGGFIITLPNDWAERDSETATVTRYSFQATAKNEDNRWLDIYVDSTPAKLAFNRLLPVTVQTNKIVVSGSVSDNCATFSAPGVTAGSESVVTAKWQDIDFPCDMANTSRNVIGVGTEDTQNRVLLTSSTGLQKTFIFVYTDHNASPDYQILEDALESIELL